MVTSKQFKGVTVPCFRSDSIVVALTCLMTDVLGHLLKLIVVFGLEAKMVSVLFLEKKICEFSSSFCCGLTEA